MVERDELVEPRLLTGVAAVTLELVENTEPVLVTEV